MFTEKDCIRQDLYVLEITRYRVYDIIKNRQLTELGLQKVDVFDTTFNSFFSIALT
jgi:hypothetical protein